jgi:class 3 adenylate cyclase
MLPTLDATARARLRDSAFAYVDSLGRRRLPIHDAAHVRNALARFEQVSFESDAAREAARERLLRAAKRHGIVPIGFFGGQLRKERTRAEITARGGDVARLPRGTVTFLLTDIEASTALLQRLGDGYASLLRDVRSVIRASVRKAGGHEVDSRADEFFAVFGPGGRPVDAAVSIQKALAERKWPRRVSVRVRIGLHGGRPTLTATGYVGIAVHAAARVCDAGHGGQILLSAAAQVALAATLADGVTLRRLGRYRLAGLADPEALYQVESVGLIATFPKLRVSRSRP